MKGATLIAVLIRLTTAMAAVAPIIIFGFLYVLAVEPARAATRAAQHQLAEATAELNRERVFVQRAPNVSQVGAMAQFDSRTLDTNRAGDVAESIEAILSSPAVGGVSSLSIEAGAATDVPMDSRIRLFGRQLLSTPVTVTFDARYDQIGRFLWNLRVLPTIFELSSMELTPGRAPSMHASVVLLAMHRKAPDQPQLRSTQPMIVDLTSPPEWKRNPFTRSEAPPPGSLQRERAAPAQPDPVVSTILFSSGRRVALIDGRIVRAGDRVGSAVVQSIEPGAVVILTPSGLKKRLELERPVFRIGPAVSRY